MPQQDILDTLWEKEELDDLLNKAYDKAEQRDDQFNEELIDIIGLSDKPTKADKQYLKRYINNSI